jgi:hypothetical protein
MVQIDIPFTFGVGSLFAKAVENGLVGPRAKYFYLRAMNADLLFQILLIVWFPLYFLINQFGMETSHMWWTGDKLTDYPWLLPGFFVAYFVSNLSGFHLGVWLIRRGRPRMVWVVFYGSIAVSTAWVALQPYRTLSLGTYQEWLAGTAPWLWSDKVLTIEVIADMFVFNLGLIWLYKWLKREASAG